MGMLDGKVALITGGARGQGRAHAVVSAREGADIVVVDIASQIETIPYPMSTAADLAETVRQVEDLDRRALSFEADVRDQAALDHVVSETIAKFGKIDILIANAGILSLAPLWEMSDQMWEDMIGTNLTGVWKSIKAVTPHMIERQTGSIVITSSINGLEPAMNYAHYTSSKHALVGLMRSAALELAPYGIRANTVNPGAIQTGMTDNQVMWNMLGGYEGATQAEAFANAGHFHALKGAGILPPEVIANAALFLNSDLASAVTGVVLPVDAGHMILPGFNHVPVP
ncbi:MAG: mycofactocin-coupled SDR family oxidoreductase [Microbacteriaceae bacterium]|jgi:SDR family mycofactocin-dependent oxidoreductase